MSWSSEDYGIECECSSDCLQLLVGEVGLKVVLWSAVGEDCHNLTGVDVVLVDVIADLPLLYR